MFKWIAKRTKAYKDLESTLKKISIERTSALQHVDRLEENIEGLMTKVKSGGLFVEKGNSSIVLEIDKELKVTVKSRINSEISPVLIDNGYITPAQSEDEAAINLAFILIANEATEQVIENINSDEQT